MELLQRRKRYKVEAFNRGMVRIRARTLAVRSHSKLRGF